MEKQTGQLYAGLSRYAAYRRKQLELSQAFVGRCLNPRLSAKAISNIENGRRRMSASQIEQLAVMYDTTAYALTTGVGYKEDKLGKETKQ